MSEKGKWILFLCVSITAFYLIRKLLIVLGLTIIGEVLTYLFFAVVGFIGVNILVPEKSRKWANMLPILCTLILLATGIVSLSQRYGENKEEKRNTLNEKSDEMAIEVWADIKVQQKSNSENRGAWVKIAPPGKKIQKKKSEKSIMDSWGYKSTQINSPRKKK